MTGALALLLLAPSGAFAAKKKLSVKVASSSQTQVSNQGALKVSFKAKGLSKLTASATAQAGAAKATARGISGQVDFAGPASKNNPKQGTLSLALTDDGQAALDGCASLSIKVKASGSGKKANASANLAEDDPECAKPVKEFDTSSSVTIPFGLAVGPDNNLWFTESGIGSVGRMTTDGQITDFRVPVPDGTTSPSQMQHLVSDITAAPDGSLWASSVDGQAVRKIDPATGAMTAFPSAGRTFSKIVPGPLGEDAVWQIGNGSLQRVAMDGSITDYPLGVSGDPVDFPPYALAGGGDGAVWFAGPTLIDGGTPSIGRLDPATGATTVFPLPNSADRIGGMTADRAGRLWFTIAGPPDESAIGRIDPSSGEIVTFKTPTPDSKPAGITFADDGSLWFTETNPDNIGRYDPATGEFTEYPLETQGSLPWEIVQGPDGLIYFTETGTGKIGQLDPNKAPAGDPNPSNGIATPPFTEDGRCADPGQGLCQSQTNTGGSFKIGDALDQQLPADLLNLTATLSFVTGGLEPPVKGPMLASQPLDVEVAGTPATTQIGLSGRPQLVSLFPFEVLVPVDLYVSQPGNPAGGCVIGPLQQDLFGIEDDEGDTGAVLYFDPLLGQEDLIFSTGLLADGPDIPTTATSPGFDVPLARGCGALTDIINNVLGLPSPASDNAIRLPFGMFITAGGADSDNPPAP
jgi:streptogramin lyase